MPKIKFRKLMYDDAMAAGVSTLTDSGAGDPGVYDGFFVKTGYRTVTFLEPPTGELLAFLKAYAVKQ